jgi:hypothetical protein
MLFIVLTGDGGDPQAQSPNQQYSSDKLSSFRCWLRAQSETAQRSPSKTFWFFMRQYRLRVAFD